MDLTPGTGALGAYVRVREGCVGTSGSYLDAGITVYSDLGMGSDRRKVAFELILGHKPNLSTIKAIFQLTPMEYVELARLWPLVLQGHVTASGPNERGKEMESSAAYIWRGWGYG